MFNEIDTTLVHALRKYIPDGGVVAFIPRRNDFFANYLAPAAGFKTLNIGGDKNIALASNAWNSNFKNLAHDLSSENLDVALELLQNDEVDYLIIPLFDMLWAAHYWPCDSSFLCPHDYRNRYAPMINILKSRGDINMLETEFFVIIQKS